MKQRHTPTICLVGGVSTMLESLSICVHTSEQSTENGEITYWPAHKTTKGTEEKVQMLSKLKTSWSICRLYASRCNLISFHSTPKGEKARVACMLLQQPVTDPTFSGPFQPSFKQQQNLLFDFELCAYLSGDVCAQGGQEMAGIVRPELELQAGVVTGN